MAKKITLESKRLRSHHQLEPHADALTSSGGRVGWQALLSLRDDYGNGKRSEFFLHLVLEQGRIGSTAKRAEKMNKKSEIFLVRPKHMVVP